MEQLTIERLHDNLSRLKLTRAAEVLDTIVDQANDQKISYLGFRFIRITRTSEYANDRGAA